MFHTNLLRKCSVEKAVFTFKWGASEMISPLILRNPGLGSDNWNNKHKFPSASQQFSVPVSRHRFEERAHSPRAFLSGSVLLRGDEGVSAGHRAGREGLSLHRLQAQERPFWCDHSCLHQGNHGKGRNYRCHDYEFSFRLINLLLLTLSIGT